MKTLIFDMDDTLAVEEDSTELALRKTCQFAKEKVGIDPEDLYDNIRETCRSIWYGSPAHSFFHNVELLKLINSAYEDTSETQPMVAMLPSNHYRMVSEKNRNFVEKPLRTRDRYYCCSELTN